jgi:predicted phage terminase large subunit-like protein
MAAAAISLGFARALLNDTYRRSLYTFHQLAFEIINGFPMKPAPYLDAIAHQLERMARGENRKLINSMPPRHGKSELCSVSFVAWMLGHAPAAKFMLCSYGLNLSQANLKNVRKILEDPRYQTIFPGTRIDPRERRRNAFATTASGGVMAVSTGGSVTGFGTHFLIIDDLHKADEALTPVGRDTAIQFYQNTLVSRFNDPAHGRTIVVGQRLHEEDIVGHLLQNGSDWHHICLPAIAERDEIIPLSRGQVWLRRIGDVLHPAHMPTSELEERRRESGPRIFGAQYQQNPCVADGSMIRLGWFGRFEEQPPRSFFHRIVQSWDLAYTTGPKSDFSVGMTWGYRAGKWYLLDLIRARMEYPDVKARVQAWHRQWKADALVIEGSSIGVALHHELRQENLPGILRAPTPRGSKIERLAACTARLATGNYLLPASAPWLQDFEAELVAFPEGGYDDQVDAFSQFMEFAFDNDRWIKQTYDSTGRPDRIQRPERRSHYYDGHAPSSGSW